MLSESLPEDPHPVGTVAARVRRYAMLRSAQRALHPIRSLAGRLPAEDALLKLRTHLQRIGLAPAAPGNDREGATQTARAAALGEIDQMLETVATELRSIAEGLSLAELRAALPQVRETRPSEVAALLDLCLEDEDRTLQLLNLIEYLVTLLATDHGRAERVVSSDPVCVTPRLREICEGFGDYNVVDIQAGIEALDEAIVELSQRESIAPVVQRTRELKARAGQLIFVPDLLRKIVEYNVAAANRLQNDLEAERTLHRLEVENATRIEATAEEFEPEHEETPEPALDPRPAAPEWSDADPGEGARSPEPGRSAAQALIREVADAIGLLLTHDQPPVSRATEIARVLDLSHLSPWERQALTSGRDSDADLLREVVVVGLLLRKPAELDFVLHAIGLGFRRLEEKWVPRLDGQMQRAIAERLQRNEHAEAKRLSQTRAKFLYRALKTRRRAPEPGAPVRSTEAPGSRPCSTPAEKSASPARYTPQRSARSGARAEERRARTGSLNEAAVWILALAVLVSAGALRFRSAEEARSASVLPAATVGELSPYLKAAVRDGAGFGPTFFGTVNEQWARLETERQREEAVRIGDRLRWSGVEEVQLLDEGGRLVARYLRGDLLHPPPSP